MCSTAGGVPAQGGAGGWSAPVCDVFEAEELKKKVMGLGNDLRRVVRAQKPNFVRILTRKC